MPKSLSLALLVLLVGCANPDLSNEITPAQNSTGFVYDSPNVLLSRSFEPVSLVNGRTEDGSFLKFTLVMRNIASRRESFNYSVIWTDDSGAAVPGAVKVSRTVSLNSGETTTLSAISTSPRATRYRIILSELR
jgi:uncharacterized protein YcfL